MSLRAIPKAMERAAVAQIDARLDAIRSEYAVNVLLAIESGSRAWGFPSPDSDYDCRFIYLRPSDDYLALFPERDVIETPLEGELDVNGWDLQKALKLLLKGNAVVIEWLTSPIVYTGNRKFRDDMIRLAQAIADRSLVGRHYLHLGLRQRKAYFANDKDVALKKIFYALRPAAALRWLRLHPGKAVAPMHFPTLMRESEVPAGVAKIVQVLTEQKAVTRELGKGRLPKPVANFIDQEFSRAREMFETDPKPIRTEAQRMADQFFRSTLERWS
jgi:predicted nucleotidyltransferase